MISFKCAKCGTITDLPKRPKKFLCPECGVLNTPADEMAGDEACGCILPTGFEWKLPSGEFQTPFGLEYTTADGDRMTRLEWIEDFGCDPKTLWENMKKYGKEGIPGFANLSTLGRRK